MLEILFSDSACGSLRQAQNYGRGKYRGGLIGVVIGRHADGSRATEEELELARQEHEARERLAWEAATPMGGNLADIYGLSFGLSIGDISEDFPGEKRIKALEWLFGIYPDGADAAQTLKNSASKALNAVLGRISAGEPARIWYSQQPDELCGLYWLMAQIDHSALGEGQLSLVELPSWLEGWGGVHPGQWHSYLGLQKNASPEFCAYCASSWERLQQENAPLRAVLNGRLVSVPESFYDHFILEQIAAQPDEFVEAMVVGRVLGEYGLGIGDAWIAHRMEAMIAGGSLVPTSDPAPDSPVYHRTLKKCDTK